MSTQNRNARSRGILRRLTDSVGFYVSIPAALAYLFCFALFWRPVANWLLGAGTALTGNVDVPEWLSALVVNVFASAAAALLVGLPIWLWLRSKKLGSFAKTYLALNFDEATGEWEEWGELTLKYELAPSHNFQPHFKCRLVNGNVVLQGTATLTQDQYLAGHYKEKSNHLRRRTGAFLMHLNGDGDQFEGTYSFVDPRTHLPKSGRARWVMK